MRPREKFIFLLSIFLTRSRLSSMPETVKLEFTDKCINQFPIGFICYIGFYYLLIVVRLLSSSEWINFSLFYLTNIFFFIFQHEKKTLRLLEGKTNQCDRGVGNKTGLLWRPQSVGTKMKTMAMKKNRSIEATTRRHSRWNRAFSDVTFNVCVSSVAFSNLSL